VIRDFLLPSKPARRRERAQIIGRRSMRRKKPSVDMKRGERGGAAKIGLRGKERTTEKRDTGANPRSDTDNLIDAEPLPTSSSAVSSFISSVSISSIENLDTKQMERARD
jgi:hypothetical protein